MIETMLYGIMEPKCVIGDFCIICNKLAKAYFPYLDGMTVVYLCDEHKDRIKTLGYNHERL